MIHPKLRNIVEFLSEGIELKYYNQVCDEQLKFIFVGDKFCQLLGLSRKEIINKDLRELDSPISKLSDKYLELHLPVLKGDVNKAEYLTYMHLESGVFIARNNVSPMTDNGSIIGIYIRTKFLNYFNDLFQLKINIQNSNLGDLFILSEDMYQKRDANLDEFAEVVLFFILLGKYDKEIAILCSKIFNKEYSPFNISKFITRKLFATFEVDSRNQLINKALSLNILSRIPSIIFSSTSVAIMAY